MGEPPTSSQNTEVEQRRIVSERETWTIEDVGKFLKENGLSEYVENFKGMKNFQRLNLISSF